MMNLQESVQEPQTRDLPKKDLQQRRHVLLGVVSKRQEPEA